MEIDVEVAEEVVTEANVNVAPKLEVDLRLGRRSSAEG